MLRLLVQGCTSAVHGDFADRVASRLSACREELNLAAARYAIDLAKALNLVNENLVWTNLGHLLNVVSVSAPPWSINELCESERVLFLRIFLEFDGAALIFFSKKIESQNNVPGRGENWIQIAQELFETTYDEYLQFLSDPQVRIRVRQLAERRRRWPFRGKSGPHQSLIHIQTLHRLGLVERVGEGTTRVYKYKVPAEGSVRPTTKLIELIPDLMVLENVTRDGALYDVAKQVLGYRAVGRELSDHDFLGKLLTVYDQVMATGVALCPIQTVAEAIQVQSVVEGFEPPRTANILLRLRKIQQGTVCQLRFHVDRGGHPAYIKIN